MANPLKLSFLAPMAPFGWLVVRAGGGAMLAAHGWHKLNGQGVSNFATYLESMKVPMPEVAAWMSVAAELGGGALLVLGLCTRLAGALVAINMAAAIYYAHHFDLTQVGTPEADFEYPLLLLLLGVAALFHGGGALSLDGRDRAAAPDSLRTQR